MKDFKYYLIYGFYPIESDMNINFLKQYYHTENVMNINKKKYDEIMTVFLQYINNLKKIFLSNF